MIKPIHETGNPVPKDYWIKQSHTPAYWAWAGYCFENICTRHIDAILDALRISGMGVNPSTWQFRGQGTKGAQIDLVLDRADRLITLCEIKFSRQPLRVTDKFLRDIRDKEATFVAATNTHRRVTSALISASPVHLPNRFHGALSGIVTSEDLFMQTV